MILLNFFNHIKQRHNAERNYRAYFKLSDKYISKAFRYERWGYHKVAKHYLYVGKLCMYKAEEWFDIWLGTLV